MSRVSTNLEALENAPAAIADLSLTGTYGTDDDNIQAAVNAILAALRDAGVIKAS